MAEGRAMDDSAARGGIAHRWRSTSVLAVEGPDRLAFLQGQLTQEVQDLVPGEARPVAGLTPRGKLLYVGSILGLPDRVLLLLPGQTGTDVRAHLAKYAVFQKVDVREVSGDFTRLALYGPAAARLEVPSEAARLPAHGEFAFEIVAPIRLRPILETGLAGAGSIEVGDAAAEALRVEAGRPRFGQDIGPDNLPDEAGIPEAISVTKGCYVGQEIVARRRTYGRRNRRLVGYRFPEGSILPGAVLSRPESPPEEPERTEAGRVTSTAVSARFGPIGLGYAFHDVPEGGRLLEREPPRRAAIVSALPFA